MGLGVRHHLDAVLHPAQEHIGLCQHVADIRLDPAVRGQGIERFEPVAGNVGAEAEAGQHVKCDALVDAVVLDEEEAATKKSFEDDSASVRAQILKLKDERDAACSEISAEVLARYDAVTREDILGLARETLDFDRVSFSAVGRLRPQEEYAQQLKG